MIKLYWLSTAGTLALFGAATMLGWGFAPVPREKLPADARTSPGGYRSFHFWHSGLRGGK